MNTTHSTGSRWLCAAAIVVALGVVGSAFGQMARVDDQSQSRSVPQLQRVSPEIDSSAAPDPPTMQRQRRQRQQGQQPQQPQPEPRRQYRQPPPYTPVSDAVRDKAEKQILIAVRSADPFLRCNAIETGQYLPQRAQSLVAIGLQDRNPAVRYAALTMLGKMKMVRLAPAARQHLSDSNPSVRAAAMFALHQCGDRVDITPMASMLESDSSSVRANTAMLLGLMGNIHAVGLLKDKAHRSMRQATPQQAALMRLQFAEATVRLGDDLTMDAIRASAFSQFEEVRVLAVSIMGRLRDREMEPALQDMLDQDPVELRLAAADALARMGRPQGMDVLLEASQSDIPMVRAQAAMAMGGFPHAEAAQALGRLLNDRSQQVRVSAAAAVLRRDRR